MKKPIKKTFKPRVEINFNTGTRVMKSKKDKARSRQALKNDLRKIMGGF